MKKNPLLRLKVRFSDPGPQPLSRMNDRGSTMVTTLSTFDFCSRLLDSNTPRSLRICHERVMIGLAVASTEALSLVNDAGDNFA
jgi:hypothetical protein